MSSEIISYLVGFSLSLGLLWFVYQILIKRAGNIVFNRYYLLSTLLFSLLVPTIKISTPFPISKKVITYSLLSPNKLDNETISTASETADFNPNETPKVEIAGLIALKKQNVGESHKKYGILIIKWFYYIICSLLIFHFIFQVVKIARVIHNSKRTSVNGFSLLFNNEVQSPYSFLKCIIINPVLYSSDEYQHIVSHETEHCRQFHFIEVVLLEVLKPLLWFVPFIWLYEKEIKENHEYLADYGVLNGGGNLHAYQQTLLKGSLGMQYLGITSFLHKSFIKKRITMMTKQKTKRIPIWKLALLIPVVLFSIWACSSNPTNLKSSVSKDNPGFSETLQLNKSYQFIERTNGNFLCRGTFTFFVIDENGVWEGIQNNFTQYSKLVVTAKVTNDTIEIYTADPWNETWKVTSMEKGIFRGDLIGNYSFAKKTKMTFELRDNVSISELMPDYKPKSTEYVAESVPFLKNEKYYWELWDEKTQTSSLAGCYVFKKYDPNTKVLSGVQYNYRMASHMPFTGTYADGVITINIGEPWNEVWTAKLENNMYVGEQSYNHNAANFKGSGVRSWRMSTKPFEDRIKVFEELTKK